MNERKFSGRLRRALQLVDAALEEAVVETGGHGGSFASEAELRRFAAAYDSRRRLSEALER